MVRPLDEVLTDAVATVSERDALAARLRAVDARLVTITAEYGQHVRQWGLAPHHLRNALRDRGLLSDAA